MKKMKIGFIGLGNVGSKLAGSLCRNGFELVVRDLDRETAKPLIEQGAVWGHSPREIVEQVDMVITCLPSPAASALSQMGRGGGALGHGMLLGTAPILQIPCSRFWVS